MLSVALLSLFASAVLPPMGAAAANTTLADPPVRVSLDRRTYQRGDRARVTVRVRDDGYLMVMQLSADGYVRVLFPLDPGDDDFVRGSQGYEIRGRGDREAFSVDAAEGSGAVYAAWSREPFRFDDFVRGDHWDYRVLWDSALPRNPEAGLTNIVQQMSTGRFDYDIVSYVVQRQVAYAPTYYPAPALGSCAFGTWYDPTCSAYYPNYGPYYGTGLSFGFTYGFGSPYSRWYGPRFYRPLFYDPLFYDPFFYDPFFYGYGRCYYCGPTVVVINRPRYPGFFGYPGPTAPYQWKPGSPGGGGVIGVHYRPRSAFASTPARPASPLYLGSRFRRAGEAEQPGMQRRAPAPGIGNRGGGSPGGVAAEGWRRVDDGGVRTAPQGAIPVGGVRGTAEPRRMTPGEMRRRAEPPAPTPRPVEPRATEPRRMEPRSVEPRTVEPRPVEPRTIEPRTAEPSAAEPRRLDAPRRDDPRATPPPRAEQPRPASTRRSEPPPRSAPPPRAAPSRPAAAPAQPRAEMRRADPPAPRAEGGRRRP